ncbi:hypothetical protein yaldo0001_28280 [Yersinia aldovae ATCC 35236]|uniref:Uncharacterized protein n=1 Tax=Yersinia aldovae TaxID=29483 RepID=A0A0T9U2R2_YERAL|nr:hypothetical protein [Yersinia aldovae]EEP95357.1 hypothetical protein yaldo0001_28280 [Yersinia aldovae ATCC 35236]CNL16169.1 Uncharacterised protein [Yersinia aldovae]
MAAQQAAFTVRDLVELYLTQCIEDRHGKDGKIFPGAGKKAGQEAVRRILIKDVVDKIGGTIAKDITRKDVIDIVMAVIQRGANVLEGYFFVSCVQPMNSL